MVDLKINVTRPPVENNARSANKPNTTTVINEASNLPARDKWNGVDRRRRLTERRGPARKPPMVELRQRADRRRSASVNIKV